MPSLSAFGPTFYDTYRQRSRENEQAGMQDLQQIGTLMQLKNQMRAQQEDQELKSMLQQSGGNVEAVIKGALLAGRHDVAAKLAPLLEAQRRGQQKPDPRVLAPGGRLVSPTGEVIAEAPFKPEKEPTPSNLGRLITERDALPARHPNRAAYDAAIKRETERAPVSEKNYPTINTGDGIFQVRPEGIVPLKHPATGEPLKPTARERPITEYQGKNAMYGARALQSHQTLLDLEDKISVTGLAVKRSLQDMPVVGGVMGAAANVALSKEQQRVEQAQRNFVNAVLRQESGAVINPSEFENAIKQYFPQPGDKKAVIEQKRKNRLTAIEGFKKIAGPAWSDEENLLKNQEGWTPEKEQRYQELLRKRGS